MNDGESKNDEMVRHQVASVLACEEGPTAVEYAVMLALIICVCIAGISVVGANANSVFSKIANSI